MANLTTFLSTFSRVPHHFVNVGFVCSHVSQSSAHSKRHVFSFPCVSVLKVSSRTVPTAIVVVTASCEVSLHIVLGFSACAKS
jgi:hypothetical protein